MFATVVKLQKQCKFLVYTVIVLFLVLGTLASMPAWHAHKYVHLALLWVPLSLWLLMPVCLLQVVLLYRMRLLQGVALPLMMAVALVPVVLTPIYGIKAAFYAAAAWLAVSTVLGWQIKAVQAWMKEHVL